MTKGKESSRPRSQWFRVYTGIMEDAKVMQLSSSHFKTWVLTLCMAKEGDGTLPSIDVIAFKLRLRVDVAKQHIEALVSAGLIDRNESHLTPHNWDKYQYSSDVSTARVERFRERKKRVSVNDNETFQKPPQRTEYRIQNTDIPQTPNAALPFDVGAVPLEDRNEEFAVSLAKPKKPSIEPQQKIWFDEWWSVVWLKVGKDGAWVKFKAKITTPELFEKVMKQTAVQGPSIRERERDKQIHPETWLSKGRYLDEDAAPILFPRSQADSWEVV